MKGVLVSIVFLCFTCYSLISASAADTIKPPETLKDNQTLISSGGNFELGFFNPSDSNTNRYLGIWFKKISVKTVVWVANREISIPDSSGVLSIDDLGNLVILNGSQSVIWSSSSFAASNQPKAELPIAQLLDTGNLVLKYENQDNYIWQSFDHPSDTAIDGMTLGLNFRTGQVHMLTSWKDKYDPSPGSITYSIDGHGYPQPFLRNGSTIIFRIGPWNGVRYSGAPEMVADNTQYFVFNSEEVYYKGHYTSDSGFVMRFVIDPSGVFRRLGWNERNSEWKELVYKPIDRCDQYTLCGAYGVCRIDDTPVCHCLKGFVPKSPRDWNQLDWTHGCKRKTPLNCTDDGFVKHSFMKLPDTSKAFVNVSMSLKECEVKCLRNCSCIAYTNSDIRGGGSGCLMWFGDLIDIRLFNSVGQDLYLRMPVSELGVTSHQQGKAKRLTVVISVLVAFGVLVLSLIICFVIVKTRRKQRNKMPDQSQKGELELPLFEFGLIQRATNYFTFGNKLGQGGFGPVYKGILPTGEEIAVKRLSGSSGQGLDEFKNEIILIAKLQHRNLVRLLGCCIQNDEQMLIYEYMPNGSLDYFIFDKTGASSLNWKNRFHIIEGIGQGLLYLHKHSRLRIIHRDLKASNVLLDSELNPKISDFGVARMFRGDQTEENTKRIVGTYGYMSPEYAIDGLYSMKSDVFSLGVLILEIVSGKRNRGFNHHGHNFNLLGHAWNLWNEEKAMDLVHPLLMEDSLPVFEVLRCIQVGLLCVQQNPEDRPGMSSVVLMLVSEDSMLPEPKQPGFYNERNIDEATTSTSSSCMKDVSSSNGITFTLLDGR